MLSNRFAAEHRSATGPTCFTLATRYNSPLEQAAVIPPSFSRVADVTRGQGCPAFLITAAATVRGSPRGAGLNVSWASADDADTIAIAARQADLVNPLNSIAFVTAARDAIAPAARTNAHVSARAGARAAREAGASAPAQVPRFGSMAAARSRCRRHGRQCLRPCQRWTGSGRGEIVSVAEKRAQQPAFAVSPIDFGPRSRCAHDRNLGTAMVSRDPGRFRIGRLPARERAGRNDRWGRYSHHWHDAVPICGRW